MVYTGKISFLTPRINPSAILQEGYSFSSCFMTEIRRHQMVFPKLEETLELSLDGTVGTTGCLLFLLPMTSWCLLGACNQVLNTSCPLRSSHGKKGAKYFINQERPSVELLCQVPWGKRNRKPVMPTRIKHLHSVIKYNHTCHSACKPQMSKYKCWWPKAHFTPNV